MQSLLIFFSSKFTAIQTVESMRTFRLKLDKALRKYIESNYTNVNKGAILQLSSRDIKGLIAYKETSNKKTDQQSKDKLQLNKNDKMESMMSLFESDTIHINQGLNVNGATYSRRWWAPLDSRRSSDASATVSATSSRFRNSRAC